MFIRIAYFMITMAPAFDFPMITTLLIFTVLSIILLNELFYVRIVRIIINFKEKRKNVQKVLCRLNKI